jgi:hypothetical protein
MGILIQFVAGVKPFESVGREKAVLTSRAFILESAGTVLARAEKPGAIRRTLPAGSSRSAARQCFGGTVFLSDGSRQIGSLAPNSVYTHRAAVDLPAEWPLPVRVFIIG